jgi:hypothetical protein
MQYGLPGIDKPRIPITYNDYAKVASKLDRVNFIFSDEAIFNLSREESQFLEDSRRATTDTAVRTRRTKYIIDLILA